MKKVVFLIAFYAICSLTNLSAQSCDYYFPLKQGKGFVMQHYDPKGKPEGTSDSKVLTVSTEGTVTTANIQAVTYDKKQKETGVAVYSLKCDGANIYIDIKSLIDPQTLLAYKDMEVKTEASDLEMPSALSVGATLKDASLKMTVSSQGMNIAEVTMKILNRKIVAKESITVAAGTYEAYKITYDMEMNTKAMMMNMKHNRKIVEYFAVGVGVVKNEVIDEKGKTESSSQLLKVY